MNVGFDLGPQAFADVGHRIQNDVYTLQAVNTFRIDGSQNYANFIED